MANCKQCPHQQLYRFRDHCRVTTCQHHSQVTPNRCMAMDCAEGDKSLSVSETSYYKAYAIERASGSNQPLTLKGVETAVRRILLRVREAVRLYSYLCFIDENVSDKTAPNELDVDDSELCSAMLVLYPEFCPWMLRYLADADMISKFASARKGMSSDKFNFRLVFSKSGKMQIQTPEFQLPELRSSSKWCQKH